MKRAIALVFVWLAVWVGVACSGQPVEQKGDPELTLNTDSVSAEGGALARDRRVIPSPCNHSEFLLRLI